MMIPLPWQGKFKPVDADKHYGVFGIAAIRGGHSRPSAISVPEVSNSSQPDFAWPLAFREG